MFRALTEEVSRQIEAILTNLLEQVEAEAVFFCDRGGNIVARQSNSTYDNEQNITALAAGSFFATLEMARLLGESKFRRLIHQGERTSMYMEGMRGDMILLVVFGKDSNPGLVKLYTRDARQKLEKFNIAETMHRDARSAAVASIDFEMDETAQPFTHSVRTESR